MSSLPKRMFKTDYSPSQCSIFCAEVRSSLKNAKRHPVANWSDRVEGWLSYLTGENFIRILELKRILLNFDEDDYDSLTPRMREKIRVIGYDFLEESNNDTDAMRAMYYLALNFAIRSTKVKILEQVWDGIGEWRS